MDRDTDTGTDADADTDCKHRKKSFSALLLREAAIKSSRNQNQVIKLRQNRRKVLLRFAELPIEFSVPDPERSRVPRISYKAFACWNFSKRGDAKSTHTKLEKIEFPVRLIRLIADLRSLCDSTAMFGAGSASFFFSLSISFRFL